MHVDFFKRRDYTKPEEPLHTGVHFDTDFVPSVGDTVSFDEGGTEHEVVRRHFNIQPGTGIVDAFIYVQ